MSLHLYSLRVIPCITHWRTDNTGLSWLQPPPFNKLLCPQINSGLNVQNSLLWPVCTIFRCVKASWCWSSAVWNICSFIQKIVLRYLLLARFSSSPWIRKTSPCLQEHTFVCVQRETDRQTDSVCESVWRGNGSEAGESAEEKQVEVRKRC